MSTMLVDYIVSLIAWADSAWLLAGAMIVANLCGVGRGIMRNPFVTRYGTIDVWNSEEAPRLKRLKKCFLALKIVRITATLFGLIALINFFSEKWWIIAVAFLGFGPVVLLTFLEVVGWRDAIEDRLRRWGYQSA